MILILFFLSLTFIILTQNQVTLYYTIHGLTLWYSKMVPILLPFMILSGCVVRSGKASLLGKIASYILNPIFRCNYSIYYGMIMGFMCGFPMGARTSIELLEHKEITKEEASFLLAFCNNIGPVYVISFLLPLLSPSNTLLLLLGVYGIPLFYGIILRYTKYKILGNILCISQNNTKNLPGKNLLSTLNDSIFSSLQSIILLCGYMVICNLFMVIPHFIFPKYKIYIWPFIELTGGLSALENQFPLLSLICLMFGGLCCFLQTHSIIHKYSLSMKEYLLHKINQTILVTIYFLFVL